MSEYKIERKRGEIGRREVLRSGYTFRARIYFLEMKEIALIFQVSLLPITTIIECVIHRNAGGEDKTERNFPTTRKKSMTEM